MVGSILLLLFPSEKLLNATKLGAHNNDVILKIVLLLLEVIIFTLKFEDFVTLIRI